MSTTRSVVLELVEFIRSENIKSLVAHLVEKFGPQLEEVDYVDTFRALRLRYDQVRLNCSGITSGQSPPPGFQQPTAVRGCASWAWTPSARCASKCDRVRSNLLSLSSSPWPWRCAQGEQRV